MSTEFATPSASPLGAVVLTPTLNVEEAISLYRDGEHLQAIEALTPLLNDETAAEILGPLSGSHFWSGDYETAMDLAERLIALDASPALTQAAHISRGNCQFRLEQFAAAEESFKSVLDTPSAGTAAYGLACLRAIELRPQEALDWLEKAIKERPELKSQIKEDEDLKSILPYVRLEEMIKEEKEPEFTTGELKIVVWLGLLMAGTLVALRFCCQVVPQSWRTATRRFFLELVYLDERKLHGFRLGTLGTTFDEKPYLDQIDEALNLIQRVWPQCYERMQQDLRWIAVHRLPTASGNFNSTTMACQLNMNLFLSTEDYEESGDKWDEHRAAVIQQLASVIVHEACHARMHKMGFRRTPELVEREEKVCRQQQSRFMQRAKSDTAYPVDANHDAVYDRRFGMYERWYYRWVGSKTLRDRTDDVISTLGGDEAYTYGCFLDHVWSDVERYVAYVEDLRESPDAKSKDVNAWFGRGTAYLRIMRHSDAIADYQRTVELRPNDGYFLRALGKASYVEDKKIAIDAFEQALELDPHDAISLFKLTPLLARHKTRHEESIELSDRLAAECYSSHRMLLYQAWTRTLNDQFENALPFVEQALEYHPECIWGSLLGYEVNNKLGNSRKADACWDNYVKQMSLTEFETPLHGHAVVLRSKTKVEVQHSLTLMYSTSADIDTVEDLASRLLEQSKSDPTNLKDEYLHSMVRLPFGEEDTFKLPESVAGNSDTFLTEMSIPAKCFELAQVSPDPLGHVPISYDAADPTARTHRLFS